MAFTPVCNTAEISSTKPKLFTINSVKILVVKDFSNNIWAFDSTCTHADKSLENGKWDSEKAYITCPFHFAVFSISQAGLALSPPAVLPLNVYPTKIVKTDSSSILHVDLDS